MNATTLWLVALALFLHGGLAAADEQTLQFGSFGTVTVYRPSPQPAHVVLFVSGDGGWNLGVVDMARELATAVSMPGAHHFGGDYDAIADTILKAWRGKPSTL